MKKTANWSRYFELVRSSLNKLKEGHELSVEDFDESDSKILTECLKEDIQETVNGNVEQEVCVAVFIGRVKRLNNGDKNTWSAFRGLVEVHREQRDLPTLKEIEFLRTAKLKTAS